MNKVTVSNPWASESNTLTQWLPVSGQLTAGARLFDIRPTLYQQTYATGHYSHAEILGWVGLSGQTMQEIVDQINAFLDVNHELVILRLWASQNINDSHRPFNQKEWDDLMALMAHPTTGLRHLFVADNPTQVDLKTLPLQKYIGNGKSAVVVQIQQFDVNIDAFASKGFYKDWQLQYYDVYSDTTDFQKMKDDQFKKMRDYCSANPIDKRVLFVLAWGLTLEGTQNLYGNIRQNGDYANRQLFKVFPEVSKEVYPNLISIDSIRPGDLPALAMAINWKIKK
ncbi:hypothetical protein FRB91_004609 [Serendipita sp. 411]|nr:hypothetical protein FRB91_004609 [Serendipita sp. 411]